MPVRSARTGLSTGRFSAHLHDPAKRCRKQCNQKMAIDIHRQGTGAAAGGLLMPSLTHGGGSSGSEGPFDPVEPLMAFAWTGRALGWIGRALGWIGRGLGKGILENECKNCGSWHATRSDMYIHPWSSKPLLFVGHLFEKNLKINHASRASYSCSICSASMQVI